MGTQDGNKKRSETEKSTKMNSKDKGNSKNISNAQISDLDSGESIKTRQSSLKLLKTKDLDKYSQFKDGDAISVPCSHADIDLNEKKKTDNVIHDIMFEEKHAKEMVDQQIREEGSRNKKRSFNRQNIMKREVFSLGNLDVYLHFKYRHYNILYRSLIECAFVFILFMIWPTLLVIISNLKTGNGLFSAPKAADSEETNPITVFFKTNLFFTLTYFFYIWTSLLTERILIVSASFLQLLGIHISTGLAEKLQIISTSRDYLRNGIVSLIVFLLSTMLLSPYKIMEKRRDPMYILISGFLWFGAYSFVLFAEKIFMNHLTSELRRKTFKDRILEANFQSFVFVKLAAIADASDIGPRAVAEVIQSYNNDFDIGFFLKYAELDLNSESRAQYIAEGILGQLGIVELSYDDLRKYFPHQSRQVHAYLSGKETKSDAEEFPHIEATSLIDRCKELYQIRSDISRSLYYRDIVLRKLDAILISVVSLFGLLGYLMLLNVDWKFYATSIGPAFFGFGWIFQDSIKEIYRCFVFLLANHPYDCGDRVVIDNDEMIVHSIDLLYSTFVTVTGKVKYIPNAYLFLKPIENIRRSTLQSEKIKIIMPKNTPYSAIQNVQIQLSEFLKKNANEFTGTVYILNFQDVPPADMRVIFAVEHNSNFQDIKPKFQRRGIYTEALENILEENNVPHNKAFEYSD